MLCAIAQTIANLIDFVVCSPVVLKRSDSTSLVVAHINSSRFINFLREMGRYCFINGCNNTRYQKQKGNSEEKVTFFGFPSEPVLREQWVEAVVTLNRQESALQLPKYSTICIQHFSDTCIEQFGLSSKRLKPHAVPSIFPNMLQNNIDFKMEMGATPAVKSEVNAEPHDVDPLLTIDISIPNKAAEFNNISNSTSILSTTSASASTTMEDRLIVETPRKVTSLTGTTIRYPGDITNSRLEGMSPRTMLRSIRLLKEACTRKDHLIKRLRTQHNRQKKKIQSLSALLSDLKRNC